MKHLLSKNILTKEEIISLLEIDDPMELRHLYKRANEVRKFFCGNDVHLRGIIEFSNHCDQQCSYCGLRCPNNELERYRMRKDEIIIVNLSGRGDKDIQTVATLEGITL